MRVKRWLSLFLAVAMVLTGEPVSVFAEAQPATTVEQTVSSNDEMEELIPEAETQEDVTVNDITENDEEESIEEEDVSTGDDVLNEGNIASGTSNNVTWVIDANGCLTISGSGDYERSYWYYDNFFSDGRTSLYLPPWCEYASSIKTAKVTTTDMTSCATMFGWCEKLTSVDVSNFDTSKVTDMRSMFYKCKSLQKADLRGFDTSNVTNFNAMFFCCHDITSIDVSSFNTSNATNMGDMFFDCLVLTTLNLSNFDTTNVTNMYEMFSGCYKLANLNLGNFNTPSVTTMARMFRYCYKLTSVNLSGFDTSNVTNMTDMFLDCEVISNLDLGTFDMSKVVSASGMFSNCANLKRINTPTNVGVDVALPTNGTWTDYSKNTYSSLPKNLSYSVNLVCDNSKLYSIAYNNCTGASNPNPNAYIPGQELILKNPIRNGYAFNGWYTNARCTTDSKITSIPATATENYVLYAKWTPKTYKVTYARNEGGIKDYQGDEKHFSCSGSIKKQTITGGTATSLRNPSAYTIKGYTFKYWSTNPDGTGDVYYKNDKVSYFKNQNVTLYANWEKTKYSIVWKGLTADEISKWNLPTEYYYDSAKIDIAQYGNVISRDCYKFKGLYTKANTTSILYKFKAINKYSTGTKTVYVNLVPYSYKVTYYPNISATNKTRAVTISVKYDQEFLDTVKGFSNTGYNIYAWNTAADGSGTSYAYNTKIKNLTSKDGGTVSLYAQWEVTNYPITYNGLTAEELAASGLPQTYTYFNSVNFSTYCSDIKRTGYTLNFYSDKQYKNKVTSIPKGKTGSKVYYLRYDANKFNVVFHSNNSANKTYTQTITYNSGASTKLNCKTAFSLAGWQYNYWTTNADGTGTTYDKNGAIDCGICTENGATYDLYAKWEIIHYSIKYMNMEDDEISAAGLPLSYTCLDSNINLSNYTVTSSGETFKGFYTKSGSAYKVIDVKKLQNVTVYAKWTGHKYTVVYDKNATDGSVTGQIPSTSGTYSRSTCIKLAANKYQREGYTFAGWNTKADGTGKKYSENYIIKGDFLNNCDSNQTVRLYAQWDNGKGQTISETSLTDSEITAKLDTLLQLLADNGVTNFACDKNAHNCTQPDDANYGYSHKKRSGDGHPPNSCANCYSANVVTSDWFVSMFPGFDSITQFPANKDASINRYAWSCMGFQSFVEWYIFKNSNKDSVCVNTKVSNVMNLRPGDAIRMNGHSLVVYSVDSVDSQNGKISFTAVECNLYSPQAGNDASYYRNYIRKGTYTISKSTSCKIYRVTPKN